MHCCSRKLSRKIKLSVDNTNNAIDFSSSNYINKITQISHDQSVNAIRIYQTLSARWRILCVRSQLLLNRHRMLCYEELAYYVQSLYQLLLRSSQCRYQLDYYNDLFWMMQQNLQKDVHHYGVKSCSNEHCATDSVLFAAYHVQVTLFHDPY